MQGPRKHVATIGIVENEGPNNLKRYLVSNLARVSSVDIAVGFVTGGGLDHLLPMLKKAAGRVRVRILTGLFQSVTEPAALRRLMLAQANSTGNLEVRLSSDPRFHWKAYLLRHRSSTSIAIGSSNLTGDGLRKSGELNFTAKLPSKSPTLKRLERVFESEWTRAKPLTTRRVDLYDRHRPSTIERPRTLGVFKAVMGASDRAVAARERLNRSYWLDATTGWVSPATMRIVEDETDWDDRGWHWYSVHTSRYSDGDRMVLFDFSTKWVELAEVMRTTRTDRPTADGRYFAAYRRVERSSRRRISTAMWSRLRSCGINLRRADTECGRKLPDAQFNRIVEVLGLG